MSVRLPAGPTLLLILILAAAPRVAATTARQAPAQQVAPAGAVAARLIGPGIPAVRGDAGAEVRFYAALAQEGYTLAEGPAEVPEEITEGLRGELRTPALTVSDPEGEPVMDLWFVSSLPAPAAPPGHPLVSYGTLPEGAVLAVMRLHREHRDFRDQAVPAGTYVARYLHQPADGNHLGETTYRDFAVLVPPPTATSAAPQRFDVTLGQALTLNTHPLVWGLWPAERVTVDAMPGLTAFEDDKWALKLQIPRAEGDPLTLALVVVGNERSFY